MPIHISAVLTSPMKRSPTSATVSPRPENAPLSTEELQPHQSTSEEHKESPQSKRNSTDMVHTTTIAAASSEARKRAPSSEPEASHDNACLPTNSGLGLGSGQQKGKGTAGNSKPQTSKGLLSKARGYATFKGKPGSKEIRDRHRIFTGSSSSLSKPPEQSQRNSQESSGKEARSSTAGSGEAEAEQTQSEDKKPDSAEAKQRASVNKMSAAETQNNENVIGASRERVRTWMRSLSSGSSRKPPGVSGLAPPEHRRTMIANKQLQFRSLRGTMAADD